jgi:hypothetical protein
MKRFLTEGKTLLLSLSFVGILISMLMDRPLYSIAYAIMYLAIRNGDDK